MKEREMIIRLRDLRRQREQRAREIVSRRCRALHEAESEVAKAEDATERHRQETAADEQSTFGSLAGQPLDVRRMHQLQGQFQKSAAQLAQLRDSEQQTAATERSCRDELASARKGHATSLRAVAKLDGLLDQLPVGPADGGTERQLPTAVYAPSMRDGGN